MYRIEVYILSDRLELFQDETIQLESSVQNIKDISKVFTDYTESFTIPASDVNNKILKHWYNADIVDGFDSAKLVNAEIKLNGITHKVGKIKLEGVTLKDNKAQNYKIKFFGKLINLTDLFGDDLLSDLNLTAYSHGYNSTNVQLGLQNGILSGDIIYPLISSARNWDYNTNVAENEIKYTGSTGKGIAWNELKPALKVNRIIEAIEAKYNVTFSNDFFNNPDIEIDELFLWLNGTSAGEIIPNQVMVDFNSGSTNYVNLSTNKGLFDTENRPRRWWKLYEKVIPSAGYENVSYTLTFHKQDGTKEEVNYASTLKGVKETVYSLHADGAETDWNAWYTVSSEQEFKFRTELFQQRRDYWGKDGNWTTYSSEQTIDSNFVIAENTPKMKIIDFFSSLIKAFNLVIDPITLTSFRIIPLDDWYAQGGIQDITQFVDVKDTLITRPQLYKTINFAYSKAKDILGEQFFEQNKVGYGDLKAEFDAEGGSLDVELKFQNLLMERLSDTTTGELTDIHVGNSIDKNLNSIVLEPIMFFNRGKTVMAQRIGFINDSGYAIPISNYLNTGQESSIIEEASSYSLNFGSELSSWNYAEETNSLFNIFWKDYIGDLYSINRRQYSFTAYLPLNVINTLKLNDLIVINKKYFIINTLSTNLNSGQTKLDLLNYVGTALSASINVVEELRCNLAGDSTLYAVLSQNNKLALSALLEGSSAVSFNISQNAIKRTSTILIGTSSIFAMGLSKGPSSVPDLQAVTDEGNSTTNAITVGDGAGSSVNLYPSGVLNLIAPGSSYFMAMEASTGQYGAYNGTNFKTTLQFPAASAAHTINIPNKSGTFALLDDVTGGGYTHPAYTTRSISATGAQVLSTFNSDSIGSVTGITTRTLTPANIGAESALGNPSVSGYILSSTTAGVRSWTASGNSTLPYKVYVALVSQTGTSAPTITVLQNTLSGTPVWSRYSAGIYRATLTGEFTVGKTIILSTMGYNSTVSGTIQMTANGGFGADFIQLITFNRSWIETDSVAANVSIEIRVYP